MIRNTILTNEKILIRGSIEIEKWTPKKNPWYENVWNIISSLRAFFY